MRGSPKADIVQSIDVLVTLVIILLLTPSQDVEAAALADLARSANRHIYRAVIFLYTAGPFAGPETDERPFRDRLPPPEPRRLLSTLLFLRTEPLAGYILESNSTEPSVALLIKRTVD